MQLKLTKRTVDGILAIECNGRIVFGEESALLRDEVKKAMADGQQAHCAQPGRSELHRFGRAGHAGGATYDGAQRWRRRSSWRT